LSIIYLMIGPRYKLLLHKPIRAPLHLTALLKSV